MTEDQMDRLIRAIENTGAESWTAWALPLITLLIGFGLSQATEHLNRRRAQRQRSEEAIYELIVSTKQVALNFATIDGAEMLERRKTEIPTMTATFVNLVGMNSTVAAWTGRQLNRLLSPPVSPVGWSVEEAIARTNIAAGIGARLDLWRLGAIATADFREDHDAEWDESMKDSSAVTKIEEAWAGLSWLEKRRRRRR